MGEREGGGGVDGDIPNATLMVYGGTGGWGGVDGDIPNATLMVYGGTGGWGWSGWRHT